uniref:Uncharacterized protein n=1 Tax=Leishmania guyanensis TaxID=5670 RepID=A0A1E1ISE3_LEIGU|nr:Hypothetical protein BN36_1414890 [Leishmania guyanensis]
MCLGFEIVHPGIDACFYVFDASPVGMVLGASRLASVHQCRGEVQPMHLFSFVRRAPDLSLNPECLGHDRAKLLRAAHTIRKHRSCPLAAPSPTHCARHDTCLLPAPSPRSESRQTRFLAPFSLRLLLLLSCELLTIAQGDRLSVLPVGLNSLSCACAS